MSSYFNSVFNYFYGTETSEIKYTVKNFDDTDNLIIVNKDEKIRS